MGIREGRRSHYPVRQTPSLLSLLLSSSSFCRRPPLLLASLLFHKAPSSCLVDVSLTTFSCIHCPLKPSPSTHHSLTVIMKFFTFASMIVLACVGLVASAPTAAVEERCATCEQACPSTHFWYSPGMYPPAPLRASANSVIIRRVLSTSRRSIQSPKPSFGNRLPYQLVLSP